ncbi:ribosomal protein [Hirsutella rhossiliensis]|uniref:Ribosomal protein s15 domain-containing protein n=1 Tax=Hirsutella rhossiliensis TaxID=111463 RepID=A0A9P8MSV0_9HYPO|nr:ribosomal protein s15 domain-containing protein [Hirsutella rhossiliensis]KAH0960797.1 ribosomal protein s15 domain-containing protein [Hirsutella rhossiliensis]
MPPRLEALRRLGTVKLCLRPGARHAPPSFTPLAQTASLSLKEKKRMAKQDPYRWAQAQQRKTANLKRREELDKERAESQGDPVMGKPTPFVESLDLAGQPRDMPTSAAGLRNHYLTDAELEDVAKHAYTLTKPVSSVVAAQVDPAMEAKMQAHDRNHEKAVDAMRRITSLENSSARDRFHANVRRIVDEFGRHKTDKRSGPDTGSSEVQIAILTSKIRALSQALETNRGYKDKHNKRNLRVLVHRRQKLLRYMERKERGSERWTHMIEKLGLTPATWKGEITL